LLITFAAQFYTLYDNNSKFALQDHVTGYGPFIIIHLLRFVWYGTPLTIFFSKPKYVRAEEEIASSLSQMLPNTQGK